MGYLEHWYLTAIEDPNTVWTAIGFLGTALFGARFFIQWLSSERKGHSVIPVTFWYLSLVGGGISLFYAMHLRAWPLILGQGAPLLIYVRNLWMIYRDRSRGAPKGATP
jgi:lipid-A-disaccharide synthase-like uncharacterized protein